MAFQSTPPSRIPTIIVACTLMAGMHVSTAATTDGGADETPTPVKLVTLGAMTWSFYDADAVAAYPNESAEVAAAMKQTINNYNTVASYTGNVPVTYVTWGGVTAQASYQGSIQFGYMRSARTAQHELAHFMGMQPWVNGGKATWGSFCNGGWSGANGLARMASFVPGAGIGCSGDNGHFWDYGLNQDNEYHWLSKGRNIAIVGAMRADTGLSDGSTLPEAPYRLVSRATGTPVADKSGVESGEVIEAVSTISKKQIWTVKLNGGYMRLKNMASQRVLDGAGAAPVLVTTNASVAANAWEMIPTSDGFFMLRNQQSNKCLKSASDTTSGAALQLADCDTGWTPPAAFQFSLASPPPAGAINLPSDATDCAAEWQTCQMPDSRSYTVYYGAGGIYAIRTGVTGSIACTNSVFGDPLPGTVKRCYRKADSAAPTNALPVVSLTAPANNASYTQGAVIAFAASASDTDGTVAKVDLYDNGALIGTDNAAPFSWTWGGAAAGKHVFTAKATDNLGASVTSAGVNVNINAPSSTPPSGSVMCANQNGTCTLPSGKTATVWYGARTSYKVLTGRSGSLACNNSTFGGDPIWYARKACYYVSN